MEKDEYEMQHFDFSARQVSLERKFLTQKLLSTALKSLINKLTSTEKTQALLLDQEKNVTQTIMESFKDHLDEATTLDNQFFSIPSHVLLAEDLEHAKQYKEVDEQQIDEELSALKQQYLENSIMIAALKMENEQYKSLSPYVEDELKVHAEVLKSLEAATPKRWQPVVDEIETFMGPT